MKIDLYFVDQSPLSVQIDNTETGRLYYDLVKQNYANQKPFYTDNIKWTPEYLIELAHIAKQELGWDWLADEYTTDITSKLHKDLEYSVGRVGFDNMPEEYDWLLYDLHHCLHSIQFGKTQAKRTCNLQVEWLNDASKPLPKSFEFQTQASPGDAILINPYVGHNPLQLYMEDDYSDLDSTCKFHDIVKPSIVIIPCGYSVDKETILHKFKHEAPEFVSKHTAEKIKYYTGVAKIGRVTDVNEFNSIMQSESELIFDRLEFDE